MVPLERLQQITDRFEYLEAQMTAGGGDIARLGREYAELRPVVEEIRAYRQALEELDAARALLDDPEMRALAEGIAGNGSIKELNLSRNGLGSLSEASMRHPPGRCPINSL